MNTGIPKAADLIRQVFSVHDNDTFQHVALNLFLFQYNKIVQLADIPFLPISFFKTHNVRCEVNSINPVLFESSGTTRQQPSRHVVADAEVYESSFRRTFAQFYGNVEDYCVIGLLPSYLERQHSSLVYMVNNLVQLSGHAKSGFYLYNFESLAKTLTELEKANQKTILFGVTYALLDFAEQHPMPLNNTVIIETGGMKGRKRELLRTEVHEVLKKSFSIACIHSEYGMTELLSQAYAVTNGRFQAPPWMRVLVREEDDPFSISSIARTGGLNIIDLANIYSCAFIATEDAGRLHADGSFEVLGRLDHAEIRGCSLLAL
jgi:hypothetical protein